MPELPPALRVHRYTPQKNALACALIGAAFLDHCTGALLQQHLADGSTTTDLLQPNGRLGDSATRQKLCYSLGLLSAEWRQDLEVISQVRNIFAHTFFDVSFETPRVKELCRKLAVGGMLTALERNLPPDNPRDRFTFAVLMLAQFLLSDCDRVERRQKKELAELAVHERDGSVTVAFKGY